MSAFSTAVGSGIQLRQLPAPHDDQVPSTSKNEEKRDNFTSWVVQPNPVESCMNYRSLLKYGALDQGYMITKLKPNPLLGKELSAYWSVINSVAQFGDEWSFLNFSCPKTIMALLLLSHKGINLSKIRLKATWEQKMALRASNDGMILAFILRINCTDAIFLTKFDPYRNGTKVQYDRTADVVQR